MGMLSRIRRQISVGRISWYRVGVKTCVAGSFKDAAKCEEDKEPNWRARPNLADGVEELAERAEADEGEEVLGVCILSYKEVRRWRG